MRRTLSLTALAAAVVLTALAADAASGATRYLVIRGHGFGHGIGMSQWGAYGYAKHGSSYKEILAHYYTGTAIGQAPASGKTVRALIATRSQATISGASAAAGTTLDPNASYTVTSNGLNGAVLRRASSGAIVLRSSGPLRVRRPDGSIKLSGAAGFGVTNGRWRGTLEFRTPAVGGLQVVNDVGIDDYVRGVVAGESPSSWPAHALRAQAVAARTYAITESRGGSAFDVYSDTRSQVYKGVAGETKNTDSAVAATAGEVVTYKGKPVTTYFFSASGGHTENIENSFIGATPQPWLKGVPDPYESGPEHSWGPVRYTLSQATARLGGLVKGTLKSIKVTKRGKSPRIVKAQLVGTGGTTTVSGPTLRSRFGLRDTWMWFAVGGPNAKGKEPKVDTGTTTPDAAAPDPSVVTGGGGAQFGP